MKRLLPTSSVLLIPPNRNSQSSELKLYSGTSAIAPAMPFPTRNITLASLIAGYGATTWWRRVEDGGQVPAFALSLFLYAFSGVWALLATGWLVYAVFLYPFVLSPLRHLPQPGGNEFMLGHHRRILREPTGAPAADWINSIPNDGLIRYMTIFNQERLLVTKPKALSEVLVSKNYDFCKPRLMRQALSRVLGVGILLAEGDEHRYQRKLLTPAFAFRHIKNLYPVFWRKARESAEAIRRATAEAQTKQTKQTEAGSREPHDAAISIGGLASRTTLDIIGLAGLGRDFGALQNPDNELATTYRTVLQPSGQARLLGLLALVLPRPLLVRLPLRRNREMIEAGRFLRQTCADLVQEKKAKLARRVAVAAAEGDSAASASADIDILSVALESGGFTDANLADQLMTFLAAGHETTASAMTWAVYLLCLHPDVQDRLRAEVRAHLPPLGDRAGAPPAVDATSVDIDQLPYLGAVCSEVLRYYAPVPMTLREAAVDTTIAGQFVPRGTPIILAPWAVNKSEELWGRDAAQFNPDRWLHKAVDGTTAGAPSNYAFMSFLHGPRSCIGMAFARAEFACLLAAWVGRFSFRLRDAADLDEANIKIRGGITARPSNGLFVHATSLDGW
ncbi:cytochrome p450 monooxygenase [Grosmannia clavigera kw1407]|uniref:Cytochrome p450 monooxygenase n=1 Tax=Grosmannia clavigera (strain kw1407 / UAMH 11150) TaxID=655863 RepID=F0XI75_GROCL|nr:cytochrome p450 monooxygenase [Grosmannia clavigera kw1407]EFX02729.1 cytochrome p450 monooxygenase [Grosmannia clavigera kw1407]